MDLINGIISVLQPANLMYCFIGCLLGTLVGVLPGLGAASSLSILLPITMYLSPTGSIIMMAGLFYGAQYGGSTTSILVNIPGEAGSIATCFDGYPMTKQGRGGEALWIAAVGSFIAGTWGCVALSIIGPEIVKYTLRFGPPEYCGLILFCLTALVSLSGSSLVKGIGGGCFGLLLATVGIDSVTGLPRFNYGMVGMMRGFELIPVVVGLFGIGEILASSEAGLLKIYEGKLGKMMPRGNELKKGLLASIRGTILGFLLGLIPGIVGAVSTFAIYDFEKRISKYPEKFGTGVIEGVAAVEAGNNAGAQAAFIPLLVLGIPTGPSLAIILAALMIYGLQPGPMLFQMNKEFAWTVIGSMYIGNVMLLILNLPLVGLWARISTIPYKVLSPIILGICVVGAYSPRNTMFDVWVALLFGVLGFYMKKKNWPLAPAILGFVLGPLLEHSLRQSISMGGPMIFFTRHITVFFLVLSIAVIVISLKVLRRVPKNVLDDTSDK